MDKNNKTPQQTAEISKYYDSISSGYDELHFEEQKQKINIILQEITPKRSEKLLDVGCGTCFSFEYFKCDCYGIEPSREMLKKYSKYAHYKNKLFVGGGEDVDKHFKKDFFDYVVCLSVAHHFSNWSKSLKNVETVSKKDAIIVFSLLNCVDVKKHKKMIEDSFKVYKVVNSKDLIIFARNKKFK